jgi:hypothetical protein
MTNGEASRFGTSSLESPPSACDPGAALRVIDSSLDIGHSPFRATARCAFAEELSHVRVIFGI